jgi:hypothetical protein
MKLPTEERRKLLAAQAEAMAVEHELGWNAASAAMAGDDIVEY